MRTLLPSFLPESHLQPWSVPDVRTSDECIRPEINSSELLLEPLFRAYAASQADLQMVRSESGDLWSGGLNEPKFHVDGKPIEEVWGRPQR